MPLKKYEGLYTSLYPNFPNKLKTIFFSFVITLYFSISLVQGQTITKVFEGSRTEAPFIQNHFGIAIDATDNVFVGGNQLNVFKITPTGNVTQILDNSASLFDITQLATDTVGNVFVMSTHTANKGSVFVKKVTPAGAVTEVLSSDGDGLGNTLDFVTSITTDAADNLFVSGVNDGLANIFRISPVGDITRLIETSGASDDFVAGGIALDTTGNLFISPKSTFAHKITPAGVTSQFIGLTGDGNGNFFQGNINSSTLRVRGVATDAIGNVFITAWSSDNVFKITPTGNITQIIDSNGDGNGNTLEEPTDIVTGTNGNVFVVGSGSGNIFKITPTGAITQIMDNSGDGSGDDNKLYPPGTIATDSANDLFVTAGTAVFKISLPPEPANEHASFSAGVLTIPVVSVGNDFFQVTLNLTNAQTFEFQLGSVVALTNPSTTGQSIFNNNILSIPEVTVGAARYRAELTLTATSPFTFVLASAEEL